MPWWRMCLDMRPLQMEDMNGDVSSEGFRGNDLCKVQRRFGEE